MSISKAFDEQEWAIRLGRRGRNFRQMLEHVENVPNAVIVETGTAWDKDNWEGQGQSTLIWDWACKQKPDLKVISIDIRQVAVDTAQEQTTKVQFITGDSIKALHELPNKEDITLLYLDSCDWSRELNLQAGMHAMLELTSVWSSLSKGCMIAVDDRQGEGAGKHWVVEMYLKQIGYEPAFKNHQIGWIK